MTAPMATVLAALIASLPAWAAILTARSTRSALERHANAQSKEIKAQTCALKEHITATAAALPLPPPGPHEEGEYDHVHR